MNDDSFLIAFRREKCHDFQFKLDVELVLNQYDAIVIGAGHNGLTNGAYLAKAGLKVAVLERNPYIGGATVSRELYKGWYYSNCSYVSSLLRPEITRDLELPRHGLQVVPFGGGATFMRNGDYFGSYSDHDRHYREIARHSKKDANAYDRYAADTSRQTRLIRPFLLKTAPDPTSLKPRDLKDLLEFAGSFTALGEEGLLDTIKFWTASVGDYLNEYFETDVIKAHMAGSGIIGTALGVYSPGTAYVLLHHYMGDVDGNVGSWGFARGGMGAIADSLSKAFRSFGGEIICDANVDEIIVKGGRAKGVALKNGDEYYADIVVSNLDPKRTFLDITHVVMKQYIGGAWRVNAQRRSYDAAARHVSLNDIGFKVFIEVVADACGPELNGVEQAFFAQCCERTSEIQ